MNWIQGQLSPYIVSEHTFKSKWPDTPLQASNVKLHTYLAAKRRRDIEEMRYNDED